MFKVIRKNQKVFGAIFGVVLMVMFLAQLGPQGGQQSSSTVLRTVATLGGAKVTQMQLNIANQEWQIVRELHYVDPQLPTEESYPLAYKLLDPPLFSLIDQAQKSGQSPLFFLLYQEAERQGILVDEEHDEGVQSLLANNVLGMPQPGTEEYAYAVSGICHCVEIKRLADRVCGVVKISQPIQRMELAQKLQRVRVKFVPILASTYLDKIPAPTDADIQKQFSTFKDRLAGQFGQPGDPLGFGYEISNRVQLQFIGLNHADLRQAAVASKSKEDWYVAAYGLFKDHRDDYDSRPVSPTTQPAEILGPSTKPASSAQTGSNIRKIDDLEADFALHADLVLDDLYDQETDTLQSNIVKQITEKMSAGYGLYRDAVAVSAGKPPTGPAADYVSYQFMQDMADSIRSQFGVIPILGDIKQLKTADELTEVNGIGQSYLDLTTMNRRVPFKDYATLFFQPWLPDSAKGSPLAALAMAMWQPSNTLQTPQQNIYIFRISGDDPAHAPVFADVKEQAASDWAIATAYEKSLEVARAVLSSAQRHGLDQAASDAKLSSPDITESFQPQSIQGQPPESIPPLVLRPESVLQLSVASQRLLTTPAGANKRPQLLAELYADRIAAVIELYEAKPDWNSGEEPFLAKMASDELAEQGRAALVSELFTPQAVSDRLNYQPIPVPKSSQ